MRKLSGRIEYLLTPQVLSSENDPVVIARADESIGEPIDRGVEDCAAEFVAIGRQIRAAARKTEAQRGARERVTVRKSSSKRLLPLSTETRRNQVQKYLLFLPDKEWARQLSHRQSVSDGAQSGSVSTDYRAPEGVSCGREAHCCSRAFRSVDRSLRVGPPGTGQAPNAAFL